MKLNQYIAERNLTQGKAAQEIGISRQYLIGILKGDRIPGRAVSIKIIEWSNGMVRLDDLWEKVT